jgi:hypothetical protein
MSGQCINNGLMARAIHKQQQQHGFLDVNIMIIIRQTKRYEQPSAIRLFITPSASSSSA